MQYFNNLAVKFILVLSLTHSIAFPVVSLGQELPELLGDLYFHRYTSYEAWDSEIWHLDLQSKQLIRVGANWPVDHAMNARVSSDGRQMTFMAVEHGKHSSAAWDIYHWLIGSSDPPRNLTKGNGLRDEDPAFSPVSNELVFKQDGRIKILNLADLALADVDDHAVAFEQSMPMFTEDGKSIVFMRDAGAEGDLYLIDRATQSTQPIANQDLVQEYFPVRWSAQRFLYTRWVSRSNRNDQLYFLDLLTQKSERLSFCNSDANFSDACPLDERWIVFSSTRAGGTGGYDLFLGDLKTGEIIDMAIPGLNTEREELGAVFVPNNLTK